MVNHKRLFTFPLLALGAAFLISGCGGGGSSSSSSGTAETPAASVAGVVADGYLYNAKVCSDQNLNNICDDGEPSTLSDEDGQYELIGDDLDLYPIVVEITAGVTVDQDTPEEPIAKDYVLSTPPGMPEFISPLTTMVHQQVETNPALTVEEAEEVIKGQLGLASEDDVSLFVNYVEQEESEEPAAATYEQLHDVAQVVATTFAEMQEDVEAALESAPDNDYTLDDVLEVVVEKVVAQLDEIVTKVEEAGDEFDPETVAASTVAAIVDEGGLDVETITEELEAAATEVVQSSFETALAGEGFYSFWAETYYDQGQEVLELERWKLSLDTDGNLVEDAYEFDFETMDWVSTVFDDDEYILVGNEWVLASDAPENYDLTFNDNGSATMTHKETGETETIVAAELDLSGKLMAPFLGGFDEMLIDPTAVFPENSKGFEISFKLENDAYYVDMWVNEDDTEQIDHNQVYSWTMEGPQPVALADVVTTFALDNQDNQFLHIGYNVGLQFNDDGETAAIMETIFSSDGTLQTKLLGTATYDDLQIGGKPALIFTLPLAVQEETDWDEGQMFLIQWDESTVKFGEFIAGGTFESDDEVGLNQVAYDAILANISMAAASVDQVEPFSNDLLAGNTFYIYWDDNPAGLLEKEELSFEKQSDGSFVLTTNWYEIEEGVVTNSGTFSETATLQEDGSLRLDFDGADDNGATYAIVTLLKAEDDGLIVYYTDYSASDQLLEEGIGKLFFNPQGADVSLPTEAVIPFTANMLNEGTFYAYWQDQLSDGTVVGEEEKFEFALQLDGSYLITVTDTEVDMADMTVLGTETETVAAVLLEDGGLKVEFPEIDPETGAAYSIVNLISAGDQSMMITWSEYSATDQLIERMDQEEWFFSPQEPGM